MKKSSKDLGISKKISLIRSHFSLTADRLGELAGVSGTAIANIEAGKSLNPGAEMLASISSMLGVNLNWLLLGEGEMLKSGPTPEPTTKKNSVKSGARIVSSDEFAKEYRFGITAKPTLPNSRSETSATSLPGSDLSKMVARHDVEIKQILATLDKLLHQHPS